MNLGRVGIGSLWYVSNVKKIDATDDGIEVGNNFYKAGCELWRFDGSREMKAEAIHFFRRASEYENSDAIAWLEQNRVEVAKIEVYSITDKKDAADLYSEGIAWWQGNTIDKEQDLVRAVYCMEQASQLGSTSAQLWLDEYSEIEKAYNKGLNYIQGIRGFPPKPHRALFYFKIASQRGHHDATEWVGLLEKTRESNKQQDRENKRPAAGMVESSGSFWLYADCNR